MCILRLEKDVNFNYFYVRVTKLTCVSMLLRCSLFRCLYEFWPTNKQILVWDVGDFICCSLCWMLLLSYWNKVPGSQSKYGCSCCAKLSWTEPVGALCDNYILVYYHSHNSWLWRFACRESKRKDFCHLFHDLQSWIDCVLDWKYDQFGCPNDWSNQQICKLSILKVNKKSNGSLFIKTIHFCSFSWLMKCFSMHIIIPLDYASSQM